MNPIQQNCIAGPRGDLVSALGFADQLVVDLPDNHCSGRRGWMPTRSISRRSGRRFAAGNATKQGI
jgi:hypothetical protein